MATDNSTSDRELLELAAKAAGHLVDQEISTDKWLYINPDANGDQEPWNPLTDDGDALRLAAKLRLEISPLEGGGVEVARYDHDDRIALATETSNDSCADTRRAIVRAAAAIGAAK